MLLAFKCFFFVFFTLQVHILYVATSFDPSHHQITIIVTDINYFYLIKNIYDLDERKLNQINFYMLNFPQ